MQQAGLYLDFKSVNKIIIYQAQDYKRFGPVGAYRLAKFLLKNDELADAFMLSQYGGYSLAELKQIKYQIDRTSIKPG